MLTTLLECAVMSFRAPRKGARTILDLAGGYEVVAIMFGISFAVGAILNLAGLTVADLGDARANAISFVITNLIFSAIAFAFSTGLIFGVGKMFGGTGSFLEVATVMAWHSLITVIFTPFISLDLTAPAADLSGAGVSLFLAGVAVWLLINFITEAHRFESAWRVGAVVVGGVFAAGLLVPILAFAAI